MDLLSRIPSTAFLAYKTGVSEAYIKAILQGVKRCGAGLAISIEKHSHHKIRKGELRPDLWPIRERKAS